MTIIATWGGSDSNAYLDHTAANSIVTTTVVNVDSWTAATTVTREAAIIQASRDVDAFQYIGYRYYTEQNLEFPRMLDTFPWNRVALTGVNSLDVEQARMKRRVEEATALQANFIVRLSRSKDLDNIQLGVSGISETIGPISKNVSYKDSATRNLKKARMDPVARSLLADYMESRRIYRG